MTRRPGVGVQRRSGFRGFGGLPYSPLSLSTDLLAWWDPSTYVAGSWTDRKAGVAVTQATGSLQPAGSATSLAGTPGVTGDGADDILSGAASLLSGLTGFELHLNAIDTNASANRAAFEYGATGGNAAGGFSWMPGDGAAGNLGAFVTATTLCDRLYAETLAAAATHGVVVDGTAAAAIASMWKNGASQALTGVSTITPNWTGGATTLNLFARSGGTLPWAGTFGDVVVTRPLTTDKRAQLMSWLQRRRGA